MVSSWERFVFSVRMSSVMNGFRELKGQVMVLSGACLSSRVDRVEENCKRSELSVLAGAEKRQEDKMSLEKFTVLMDLMLRISLVVRGDLECLGTENTERSA